MKAWRWLLLAGLVIVLDQASKLAVDSLLAYGQRIPLLPMLDLTLLYNKGAAFSFLASEAGWQRWLFTLLALLVSAGIAWMLAAGKSRGLASPALALILGGALGNVIDRIAYGHVVDFILAYYGDHFFPAFNLADSAITIGAVILVLEELLRARRAA